MFCYDIYAVCVFARYMHLCIYVGWAGLLVGEAPATGEGNDNQCADGSEKEIAGINGCVNCFLDAPFTRLECYSHSLLPSLRNSFFCFVMP